MILVPREKASGYGFFESRVCSMDIEYSRSRIHLGIESRRRRSTLGPEISMRLARKSDFGASR